MARFEPEGFVRTKDDASTVLGEPQLREGELSYDDPQDDETPTVRMLAAPEFE